MKTRPESRLVLLAAIGALVAGTLGMRAFSERRPEEPAARRTETAAPPVDPWPEPLRLERARMGTRVLFLAYPPPGTSRTAVEASFEAALARIDELAARLSSYEPESEPNRANAAAGSFVPVSEETSTILAKASEIAHASEGAFDITHETLTHLWPFGSRAVENPRPPTPRELAPLLRFVGPSRVEREGRRVLVHEGTKIGLDGLAKGYIVDAAVAVLRARGLKNFLVQAGGDLYAAGSRPDGSPWTSGVRDPRGPESSFFARISLRDRAFSTAGDYARAFLFEGRRYHHILDLKTGMPATRSRSVTVLAETAFLADMLDDAIFVLGPEAGLALLLKYPGSEAVIVDSSNRVHLSPGLEGRLELLRAPTDAP